MSGKTTESPYDVAVIGAGVIGCAIARRFTLDGARVVVLEKAAEVLDGASKANSAILHTGFDAPTGSLELDCIQAGHREYEEIRAAMNLPLDRCGALVLAWDSAQEAKLPELVAQGRANGVDDLEMLTRTQALALEPGLAPHLRAAFRVPREALIDPWSAPHGYLLQALLNGAELRRGAEVTGGTYDGVWRLETISGPVAAGLVINAAGNYGDLVDRMLVGESAFNIRPRKGQFVVYDKAAARLARHILLPVPSDKTKGIVVCRTIWGNLLVGPTAEDQADRSTADLVPETLEMLKAKGAEILPGLATQEITTVYAGLRPACEHKGYQISARSDQGYITVGAIRSTGLSSALGTAAHVAGLAAGGWAALTDPVVPQMPMLAEEEARDWQAPGNDGILCHCERVTRREVAAAMAGPLAPATLAGLKRRTRVTMGRCQGFYCSAELGRVFRGAS
ncbi:NAD(P)/FAD-dependent oxidoreductase [Pseudooceanicola sp. C21-150M6]|uniref:NAD(P)/FAD-dependent oxidoreductase n=1 Tax=Pseudooceanicola sp. C21-150M6 TaxID=3434355 RepID=UPI003D7F8BAF